MLNRNMRTMIDQKENQHHGHSHNLFSTTLPSPTSKAVNLHGSQTMCLRLTGRNCMPSSMHHRLHWSQTLRPMMFLTSFVRPLQGVSLWIDMTALSYIQMDPRKADVDTVRPSGPIYMMSATLGALLSLRSSMQMMVQDIALILSSLA